MLIFSFAGRSWLAGVDPWVDPDKLGETVMCDLDVQTITGM
jgi:hypothetical protein